MHIHPDAIITSGHGRCAQCAQEVTRVLVAAFPGRTWWSVLWDERARMWLVHEHTPEPARQAA